MVVGAYRQHKKQTKSEAYKYEWIFAIQNDCATEYGKEHGTLLPPPRTRADCSASSATQRR